MPCLINQGLQRDCGFSFGGAKTLYITSKSNVSAVKKSASGQITGFTMTSGSTKFYKYEFEPSTAQLTQELQVGGSRYVNQTVNGDFAGITQAKKTVLESLANAYAVAIVQDQNDTYWYAGETGKGLLAGVLSIDTGLADADAYVAKVSLIGGSLGYANTVSQAAVTAVI